MQPIVRNRCKGGENCRQLPEIKIRAYNSCFNGFYSYKCDVIREKSKNVLN